MSADNTLNVLSLWHCNDIGAQWQDRLVFDLEQQAPDDKRLKVRKWQKFPISVVYKPIHSSEFFVTRPDM